MGYVLLNNFLFITQGLGQLANNSEEKRKAPLINIPVVVHVLYNDRFNNLSDEKIRGAIDFLNKDFQLRNENANQCPEQWKYLQANCQIDFCLDSITRKDVGSTIFRKPKYSIISGGRNPILSLGGDEAKFASKGGVDAWDATKYLNIWVVPKFSKIVGDNDDEKTQGYAQLPGGPIETDGVVVLSDFFGDGQRTATHEVGHWLNLRHIWTNQCILGLGDEVDDTPIQNSSYLDIPWCEKKEDLPSTCPQQSISSKLPKGDMPTNFMTLAPDRCMNMFTLGQKERIHELFKPGGYRYTMQFSGGCSKLQVPGENTNIHSKDPNCNENQNGDYCFQNNTELDLIVNFHFNSEIKSRYQISPLSFTLQPGQKQCFFHVPEGASRYEIKSPAKVYGYGSTVPKIRDYNAEGSVYVDRCKESNFSINFNKPSSSTSNPASSSSKSKENTCIVSNTGDLCFKNETKLDLKVRVLSNLIPGTNGWNQIKQYDCTLQAGQIQCFFGVPSGSASYEIFSPASINGYGSSEPLAKSYHVESQIYVETCKTVFVNVK
jgi:hypothetical protein